SSAGGLRASPMTSQPSSVARCSTRPRPTIPLAPATNATFVPTGDSSWRLGPYRSAARAIIPRPCPEPAEHSFALQPWSSTHPSGGRPRRNVDGIGFDDPTPCSPGDESNPRASNANFEDGNDDEGGGVSSSGSVAIRLPANHDALEVARAESV